MNNPNHTNRLADETSPYLLQHCHNPVDWWPWSDAAFEEAKRRDVPVFLSIGYSTCHWCHVMERESFESEEVAAVLNAGYVAVKVDREERPDVDAIYMRALQAATGGGGWPMSVMLDHERRPFFLATYIPREERYGRKGFITVLNEIGEVWRSRREELTTFASRVVSALTEHAEGKQPAGVSTAILDLTLHQLAQRFDTEYGGFGSAPKFPTPHVLTFLHRMAKRGDGSAATMSHQTLAKMFEGGIHDHVGGGFHRYSTDRTWLLPHFEKMLYDQALMVMAYLEGWQMTGDPSFKLVVDRTLGYVDRELSAQEGGFFCGEDADSEGEEGVYTTWTDGDLRQVLGEEDGEFFATLFGFEAEGNFRDESSGQRSGRNIPHLKLEDANAASAKKIHKFDDYTALVLPLLDKLLASRDCRIHPHLDDKVLSSWNGLMLSAFARAARAFGNDEYLSRAQHNAAFLCDVMSDGSDLWHSWRQGKAGIDGMLDDYAFVGCGLLELFQADGNPRWLRRATEIAARLLELFEDPGNGGFFLSREGRSDLILRHKSGYDGAEPAGNSIAAMLLAQLGHLLGRDDFTLAARRAVDAFAGELTQTGLGHTALLGALDFLESPKAEAVVVVVAEDGTGTAMLAKLAASFAPHLLVIPRHQTYAEELASLLPFTASMTAVGGVSTCYLCRDFACQQPVTSVDEVTLG